MTSFEKFKKDLARREKTAMVKAAKAIMKDPEMMALIMAENDLRLAVEAEGGTLDEGPRPTPNGNDYHVDSYGMGHCNGEEF